MGVKAGDQSGLSQLTQVGDEFTVFGGLTDFDFVKAHADLAAKSASFSLEGSDLIVHAQSKGACRHAGMGDFRDVDDELTFCVADVGFALSDQGSCTETPLSSSCVDNFSIFIVHFGHFCSPG